MKKTISYRLRAFERKWSGWLRSTSTGVQTSRFVLPLNFSKSEIFNIYEFFLSTTFYDFRLLLHFDKNHLFMTTAASGHSLEIFESKAELQFVLNKPSDLLLKPENIFLFLLLAFNLFFTKLKTILNWTTYSTNIARLLIHTLKCKMIQKVCEVLKFFLMFNLFSNTLLHKMLNTLLNISETRTKFHSFIKSTHHCEKKLLLIILFNNINKHITLWASPFPPEY